VLVGLFLLLSLGAVIFGASHGAPQFQFVKGLGGKLRYSTSGASAESLYVFGTPSDQVLDAVRAEVVRDGWTRGIATPERSTFVRAGETITFLKRTDNMQEGPEVSCYVLVPKYEAPLKRCWHWIRAKF
jgi:hypothetical protein